MVSGTRSGWSSSLPGGIFISTKPAPRLQNLVWRKHPAPQLESQSKKRSLPGLVHSVCNFIDTFRYLENFPQIFKSVFLLKFFFLKSNGGFKTEKQIKKKKKKKKG